MAVHSDQKLRSSDLDLMSVLMMLANAQDLIEVHIIPLEEASS